MKVDRMILASASPRRKELLEQIGLQFTIEPAKGEEIRRGNSPGEVVKNLALQKARETANSHLEEKSGETLLFLGADTVVVYQGKILGKPVDEGQAEEMLWNLQGKTHEVYTGVAIIVLEQGKNSKQIEFYECTKVTLYGMSRKEIQAYTATGEPMDKAGAYGIQGRFAAYIKGIEGDYCNVVGLPAGALYHALLKENIVLGGRNGYE